MALDYGAAPSIQSITYDMKTRMEEEQVEAIKWSLEWGQEIWERVNEIHEELSSFDKSIHHWMRDISRSWGEYLWTKGALLPSKDEAFRLRLDNCHELVVNLMVKVMTLSLLNGSKYIFYLKRNLKLINVLK